MENGEGEHIEHPATSESEAEAESDSEGDGSSASDDEQGQKQDHYNLTQQQQQNPHPHHIYDASYNPHPHHIYFESSNGEDDEEPASTDDNEWEVDSAASGKDRYCKGERLHSLSHSHRDNDSPS